MRQKLVCNFIGPCPQSFIKIRLQLTEMKQFKDSRQPTDYDSPSQHINSADIWSQHSKKQYLSQKCCHHLADGNHHEITTVPSGNDIVTKAQLPTNTEFQASLYGSSKQASRNVSETKNYTKLIAASRPLSCIIRYIWTHRTMSNSSYLTPIHCVQ